MAVSLPSRGSQTGKVFRGGAREREGFEDRTTFRRQMLAAFASSAAWKQIQQSGNTAVRLHLLGKNEVEGRTIRAQNFCGNGFLTISNESA